MFICLKSSNIEGNLGRSVLIVSTGHALCTRELVLYLTKKHTVFRVIIKVTEKLVISRQTII